MRTLLVLLLIGCSGQKADAPSSKKAALAKKAPEAPAPPKLDPRQPNDFSEVWAAAKKHPDPDLRPKKAEEIQKGWSGRTYRWTAHVTAAMCNSKKRHCVLNPFDHAKTPKRHLMGGFFPQVTFGEADFAKLKAGCKGKRACVVDFEGVLSELRSELDFPLKMVFTSGVVHATRDPLPQEQWFRPAPKLPPNVKLPKKTLRTGTGTVPEIKLKEVVF